MRLGTATAEAPLCFPRAVNSREISIRWAAAGPTTAHPAAPRPHPTRPAHARDSARRPERRVAFTRHFFASAPPPARWRSTAGVWDTGAA